MTTSKSDKSFQNSDNNQKSKKSLTRTLSSLKTHNYQISYHQTKKQIQLPIKKQFIVISNRFLRKETSSTCIILIEIMGKKYQ